MEEVIISIKNLYNIKLIIIVIIYYYLKIKMSHLEQVVTGTWIIVKTTFTTNIYTKTIATFFATLLGLIIDWNETIIWLIIIIYGIDFITWTWSALYQKIFESRKFFMWATKLLIYGIFMVIWVSLWEVLHLGNFFLSWIFAFILITDSSSILENLEKLGYHTPLFLRKYLKEAQKNLSDKYK